MYRIENNVLTGPLPIGLSYDEIKRETDRHTSVSKYCRSFFGQFTVVILAMMVAEIGVWLGEI